MENLPLRAHFDGRQIVLDEPFELEPGAKLLITVLPESAGAEGGEDWKRMQPADPEPAEGDDAPEQPFKQGYEFYEASPPAEERVVFNRVAIRDPDVNNIDGATLLLPEGWNLEGGFVWMPLFSVQANLLVRASDPQTGAAIETLPLQFYVWPMQMVVPMQIGTNYLGSVLMPPPRTPVEFVQNIYMQGPLQHLRGAARRRGRHAATGGRGGALARGGADGLRVAAALLLPVRRPCVGGGGLPHARVRAGGWDDSDVVRDGEHYARARGRVGAFAAAAVGDCAVYTLHARLVGVSRTRAPDVPAEPGESDATG